MVFVGNRHCIQIHTGPVSNLKWMDTWFNVLDPQFNLHLKANDVHTLWRVRKPSTDGVITSWEAFDAKGELILQLFGERKPGVPGNDKPFPAASCAARTTASGARPRIRLV